MNQWRPVVAFLLVGVLLGVGAGAALGGLEHSTLVDVLEWVLAALLPLPAMALALRAGVLRSTGAVVAAVSLPLTVWLLTVALHAAAALRVVDAPAIPYTMQMAGRFVAFGGVRMLAWGALCAGATLAWWWVLRPRPARGQARPR